MSSLCNWKSLLFFWQALFFLLQGQNGFWRRPLEALSDIIHPASRKWCIFLFLNPYEQTLRRQLMICAWFTCWMWRISFCAVLILQFQFYFIGITNNVVLQPDRLNDKFVLKSRRRISNESNCLQLLMFHKRRAHFPPCSLWIDLFVGLLSVTLCD